MAAEAKRRHLASLDFLRVAAMLWIVGFWHLMNYAVVGIPDGHDTALTTRITVIVLATFTMLSGYLIGMKPIAPGLPGVAAFYRRRMLRIYPPLVLALIAFVAIGLTDRSTALSSMLLVGVLVGPVVPTLWYVTMLALFYAVTPLLVAGTPGRRALTALAMMVGLLLLVLSQRLGTDPRIALYFPSFVIGLAVARQERLPSILPASAAIIGLGSILLTVGIPVASIQTALASAPMASALALALIATALRFADRVPPSAPLTMLATASFFMYLGHRLVYRSFELLFPWHQPALRIATLYLVCLPIVILLGFAGQKAYDALLRRAGLA